LRQLRQYLTSFKSADVLLISLVLAVAVVSGFRIYGNRNGRVHLEIQAPTGIWIYALDAERTVEIPGPLGNTVVRIENGSVRIVGSPCPNQTCIAGHAISQKGDWNACLPNEVIIRIDGESGDDEIDAVVN
jgi:hypothetical protein